MIKVAITGNIAGGKTTAINIIKKLGIPTIDCDKLYHSLLEKDKRLKQQLIKEFGIYIIDKNGKINTILLRKLLNIQPKKLHLLEKITHPVILKKTKQMIKKLQTQGEKIVVVDVPLLFEKKLQSMFDYVITIYCSKRTQKKRLDNRGIDYNDISFLVSNQLPVKKKCSLSDYTICNDKLTISQLTKKLKDILQEILSKP